jgi:hypothetical protein
MEDMQSFIEYTAESFEVLTEATEGHKYQTVLAKKILAAMTPQQRKKITIQVARPSSTMPDIAIYHKDHPEEPLIIECKLDNAQSGGITWVSDGKNWQFSTRSARAKQMCEIDDPTLCTTVIDMVKTPVVRNRIDKIQSELGKWFPELSSNKIPFHACKEFWPTLLDKYTTMDAGGKWQIPMTATFWKTLNFLMKNDHFLSIRGSGLFRVGGAKYPSWFKPDSAFLNSMPVVSDITVPPKGNLELRLKQSGMKQRKMQKDRELRIHSTTKPVVGQHVHVQELGKLGKEGTYNAPIGLIGSKGLATYIVSSSESGSIGQISKIHSVTLDPKSEKKKGDKVWIVKCDLNHRVGTITFETNLRINDIEVKSGVNLETNADDFALYFNV